MNATFKSREMGAWRLPRLIPQRHADSKISHARWMQAFCRKCFAPCETNVCGGKCTHAQPGKNVLFYFIWSVASLYKTLCLFFPANYYQNNFIRLRKCTNLDVNKYGWRSSPVTVNVYTLKWKDQNHPMKLLHVRSYKGIYCLDIFK